MRSTVGIWLALGAAALFGVSAPLAKVLVESTTPQLLAGLLYSGSGIGLGLLAVARRRSTRVASITRDEWPWLAAAIFSGGMVAPLLLMMGLARTPASSASLLLNLEAVFTALLAWTVFRENVDRRIAFGMACIVVGGVLLSWQGRLGWDAAWGPLAIAGACLFWGIDNNLTQKVSAADPFRIAMLKGLIAGATNVIIALALGAHIRGTPQAAGALVLGFFSYGLSLVLFVAALQRLGTARTSAYFSIGPFVGALLSLMIWRESLSILFIAAGGLMALGLYFHLTERHEHTHVHEAMTHEHAHRHDEHHMHPHSADDPPGEPHTHVHRHDALEHSHRHYPDIHHRHSHGSD